MSEQVNLQEALVKKAAFGNDIDLEKFDDNNEQHVQSTAELSAAGKERLDHVGIDLDHIRIEDPGKLEGNTVFTYLDAFCKDELFAEYLPDYSCLQELKDHYTRGGLGDVKVKKFLYSVIMEELSPIQARRKELEKDIPAVMEILHKGSIKAKEVAAGTLSEVKHAMKIDYFD